VITTTTGFTQAECGLFATLYNALTANTEQSVPYVATCTMDACNPLSSAFSMGMGMAPQAAPVSSGCGTSTTVGKLSIAGVVLGAFASVVAVLILVAYLISGVRGQPMNTAPRATKGNSRGVVGGPTRKASSAGLPPPGAGYDSYGSDYPMAPMGPSRPGHGASSVYGGMGPGMGPPGMPGGGYADPMYPGQDSYGPYGDGTRGGPPRPGGPMRGMSMNPRGGPPPPMMLPAPHGSMGGMTGPGQHMDDGYGNTRRGSLERGMQNPVYDDGYGPPPPGGRY
jgi:hypothetical protein